MLLLGVTLTAIAILFLLTTLALAVQGDVRHPRAVAFGLLGVLVVGLVLLTD